jgi:hypothetical protein
MVLNTEFHWLKILLFTVLEFWSFDIVSNFGQFYKIRPISYFYAKNNLN